MTILLLGATGRTGKLLHLQLLEAGHRVHVVVRDKKKLAVQDANQMIIEGDVTDVAVLDQALQGCDAVLSTLNISRTSDFPWAPLRTPKDFLSRTMRALLQACEKNNVRRIIFTSAWGVGDSVQHTPGWFNWFVRNSNLSAAYVDHAEQEKIIKTTSLDWTIVRPVVLTNSKKIIPCRVSVNNEPRPSFFISRASVARFMVREVEEGRFKREVVVVSNKRP